MIKKWFNAQSEAFRVAVAVTATTVGMFGGFILLVLLAGAISYYLTPWLLVAYVPLALFLFVFTILKIMEKADAL